MRLGVMAVVLACVGCPSIADARRFDYGPRIAVSMPTQGAAEAITPGFGYGATVTFMASPRSGFGADIVYYRWPGSVAADRGLDDLFTRITGSHITGTKSTVSVVQATIHMKFFAVEKGAIQPWMKVGGGVHRLNAKLELPVADLQAAGIRVQGYGPDNVSKEFGLQAGGGVDFGIGAGRKLSLDVSYDAVLIDRDPILTAFSIGLSLLSSPR